MTNADLDTMLTELATATRYLQETGRQIRWTAEHLVQMADLLTETSRRIEAALTAGLTHLHGDDEPR